jgi:hypothetical protein
MPRSSVRFRLRSLDLLAGLDVHHARIIGRCETQNGIEPFDRLAEQVLTQEYVGVFLK